MCFGGGSAPKIREQDPPVEQDPVMTGNLAAQRRRRQQVLAGVASTEATGGRGLFSQATGQRQTLAGRVAV